MENELAVQTLKSKEPISSEKNPLPDHLKKEVDGANGGKPGRRASTGRRQSTAFNVNNLNRASTPDSFGRKNSAKKNSVAEDIARHKGNLQKRLSQFKAEEQIDELEPDENGKNNQRPKENNWEIEDLDRE